MALRIVWLVAALAVSVQAGWLSDLPNEPAKKNRIVKVFQFPKTMLVGKGGVNPHLTKTDWATEDSGGRSATRTAKLCPADPATLTLAVPIPPVLALA